MRHLVGPRVLLEKSPSNMIMTRFLQALWTQKHAVHEVPMPPSAKIVHFVIITRHPIATALAHAVYPDCKMMTLLELVMHWIAQHQTMALDVKHLDSVTHIQYEELVRNPDAYLTQIYTAVGLDPARAPKRGVALKAFNNKKYHKQYCERLRASEEARQEHGEWDCERCGVGWECECGDGAAALHTIMIGV